MNEYALLAVAMLGTGLAGGILAGLLGVGGGQEHVDRVLRHVARDALDLVGTKPSAAQPGAEFLHRALLADLKREHRLGLEHTTAALLGENVAGSAKRAFLR